MIRALATIILLFATTTATLAQELRIVALNEPLDKVIKQMDLEVSFDSRALSKYRVSVEKTFSNPQQAIDFILSDKPFVCRQIGGVYVISAKPKPTKQPERRATIKPTATPAQEELPEIKMISLGEVIVTAPSSVYSPKMGAISAETTINHRTARYMPGSGDNSVFNLLRMIPGVRASGEPSDELIIWGSTAGESRIVFDGIPLFGMRGFNDNISFINPYLVREIRLMKGGYGANYGNQIGAIAEIKGNEPNIHRPSVKATVSTLTANAFASVPISKRSALSVAYRRTFYDLYQSDVLNPYNGKRPATAGGKWHGQGNGQQQTEEVYITPKYSFSDLNINYSGSAFENDTYRIALYGADDRFSYTAEPTDGEMLQGKLDSRQIGASGLYNRVWSEKSQSRLSFSFSQLNTTDDITNLARQFSAKFSQTLLLKKNLLEAGAEFDSYKADNQTLSKPTLYITDKFSAGQFSLDAGVRADFLPNRVNVQPRLSASYSFADRFTATASWGLYNQYLSRVPLDTHTLVWGLNDERLSSMHTIAGVSYRSPSGFSATIEGYLKNTKNAIRIVDEQITMSDVDIRGGDVFLKYDFPQGTVFGSYSLSNIRDTETGHEVKFGTLITLKPFILSANYVYGSGFSVLDFSGRQGQGYGGGGRNQIDTDKTYSRFDIAATYRIKIRKVQLQAGVSLINVFNTQNLKYSYTVQSKNDPITLYSGAMPFTPMLFFEFIW